MLREAGHDVVTVNEAGLMGQPDSTVFHYAIDKNRIVLTLNCRDFKALHKANPNHPGIFAVYQSVIFGCLLLQNQSFVAVFWLFPSFCSQLE